jgi:multisubunit Na+/H+ antiporter MnhB subunit
MLPVLAGLATSNKIGLAVVAAVFIAFALASSFLAPRRWPDFPGKNGLSVFVLVSIAMFVGMMCAVYFLAREEPEHEGSHEAVPALIARYDL